MATLTVEKPIPFFHPKHSLDMPIKEIFQIDKAKGNPNCHISFCSGEPQLGFPLRAKFLFNQIETPTFKGAKPTDDYSKATEKLKGEIKIPLRLIDSGNTISVGLFSLCINNHLGIIPETASKYGYKDYQRFMVYEYPEIRGLYRQIQNQSPISKAIVSHFNPIQETSQRDLIDFLTEYIGDSELSVCVRKYLRRIDVWPCYSYLRPYYYIEYYFLDSIELSAMNSIKSICPVCLSRGNNQQIVLGKRVRRSNDKGLNYICTGLGAGMGALIAGPTGAVIGGLAGKQIGIRAEDTNSSTCDYEFECPKCNHKWREERYKTT